MVTSLIKHEKIRTTDAKAKELRRWGDKLVTLAKRGDLHARRQALAIVRERAMVKKLFDMAPERFGSVSGGYTRVIKLGRRPGDAAEMSLVAFVAPDEVGVKKTKVKKALPVTDVTPETAQSKTAESEPEKSEATQEASSTVSEESVESDPENVVAADEKAEGEGASAAKTEAAADAPPAETKTESTAQEPEVPEVEDGVAASPDENSIDAEEKTEDDVTDESPKA